MTATTHALIAGAIAAAIPNPAIGLPLAAISHPFLDMIPHWDFGIGWRQKSKLKLFLQSGGDLVFGVTVTYLIFGQIVDLKYLAAAIFLSEIWDIMMMPYLLFNWNFAPFSTFYKVQHGLQLRTKSRLPWGILTQAVTITGVMLVLRSFHQFL